MNTDELSILDLPGGDPRARGRAHGEALRARIHELLDRWSEGLKAIYDVHPAYYVDRFCAETRYRDTTWRLAPSVMEEVAGIAEGAACDPDRLWVFQHVNEEFELAVQFAERQRAEGGACSTIALAPREGRPGMIAQNLDLAEYLDGFQVLLRFPDARGEGLIMTLSVPGMLSLNGMNSHGFAVCDNTLKQLRADPAGLPIYALYRILLESRSLEEALALVERTPHAAGLNWVMGDPDGVVMVERSGGQMVVDRPSEGTVAYHTNHPFRCNDWAFDEAAVGARPRPYRSSYLRLASLHQRLHNADPAGLGVAELRQVLAARDDPDYPVSRGGGRNREDLEIGFTIACSVFELDRARPRWHLASGPTHETAMRTFDFDSPGTAAFNQPAQEAPVPPA